MQTTIFQDLVSIPPGSPVRSVWRMATACQCAILPLEPYPEAEQAMRSIRALQSYCDSIAPYPSSPQPPVGRVFTLDVASGASLDLLRAYWASLLRHWDPDTRLEALWTQVEQDLESLS